MTRKASPPRESWENRELPDALLEVAVFFDRVLSEEWEIYVTPPLNGLEPDLVLLNPTSGVAVYEIRGWSLRDTKTRPIHSGTTKLQLCRRTRQSRLIPIPWAEDPIARLSYITDEIVDLYCPLLEERFGRSPIASGVVLPNADAATASEVLGQIAAQHGLKQTSGQFSIAGKNTLTSGRLGSLLPLRQEASSSPAMDEETAKDLRNWLIESEYVKANQRPLELDGPQEQLATSRTESGYRRIKGPAGSGKSQVIAARSAHLASRGKHVLIVTFNITLINYLRDLVGRALQAAPSGRIEYHNFHHWCKEIAHRTGNQGEYDELLRVGQQGLDAGDDHVLSRRLPERTMHWIEKAGDELRRWDAVLVDEGQDFQPSWWKCLDAIVREGGERILVADATQDIYDTAQAWTEDVMKGAGFSGPWAQLKESYRLPPKMVPFVRQFADRFLPDSDPPTTTQQELALYPCELRWVQAPDDEEVSLYVETCAKEILSMPRFADPSALAMPDVTFLAPTNAIGRSVVDRLREDNINAVHTCWGDSRKARRAKQAFVSSAAPIKATTLHSFKGWETRSLVIYIDRVWSRMDRAAVYAAMTRLKRHEEGSWLTVVCSAPELQEYGRSWPEYDTV